MDTFTQPEVMSKLVESNAPNASPKPDVPPKTDDPTLSEATFILDVAPIPDVTAKLDVLTKPVTLHKAGDQSNPGGSGQLEVEGCSAGKKMIICLKVTKSVKPKK